MTTAIANLTLVSAVLCAILAQGAHGQIKRRTQAPEPKAAQAQGTIQVGSMQLMRCPNAPAYCGSLERALDPAGEVPGKIRIGFEFYPHTDSSNPPLGTIVATEGGPGYATTGSRFDYVALFERLLRRRNLLLIDNRGTGTSQAIRCEPLQQSPFLTLPGIGICGNYLGTASDLYGSGLAADDMAAVLDALAIDQIDLYGDSYGTFFAQAFAGRHPERLRTLVLDSAWPVVGQNPWYPEAAPAFRHAYEAACERSLACRDIPGTASHRLQRLIDSLRRHPFEGMAHDGDGKLLNVHADATALAFLSFSQATGPIIYRETDAAARAYLDQGDSAPLLRLIAENRAISPSAAGGLPPAEYSAGLFIAVSCTDYNQLYDMTQPPSIRWAQWDAAFSAEESDHPGVYAPFTLAEFNALPLDYSVFDGCLNWPIPSSAHPPTQPAGANPTFTMAPVLVLSGEMDTLTPPGQGTKATALFSHATHVLVHNSLHVTADGDANNCASVIVLRLVETLSPGDTSCATDIPEIRTVPNFAERAADLAPAKVLAGNEGTTLDLQVAAAAVQSAGDAVARWWVNLSGSGVGLRGGTFQYSGDSLTTFQLKDYRWTKDVGVTGSMRWHANGLINAKIAVAGALGESGFLTISWPSTMLHSRAEISGVIGGRKIEATMYAP